MKNSLKEKRRDTESKPNQTESAERDLFISWFSYPTGKNEAIQLQEVWKDILCKEQPVNSHENSRRREAIQLQGLCEDILCKWQPYKAHENSHRRETIQLQGVWEDILSA